MNQSKHQSKFNYLTVLSVVIANMVGTGVFTSLGFQLLELESGFVLLLLWVIGGVIALCGAMTYAELGAALPRSGGEYNFLGRIYHPAAGFVSGWISATIGFAGPTALAAITFAAYATSVIPNSDDIYIQQLLACSLVIILSITHASNHRNSGGLQQIFTILKIMIIILFCCAAIIANDNLQPTKIWPSKGDSGLIVSGSFAISLIYVSYAYTGWNAATYLSSELKDPQKTLPWILITGTLIVMILYVLLNFVFLKVAPIEAMKGQIEIGYIAATHAFGETGGYLTGFALALLLISTVSAMTLAGPRVLQMIGEDYYGLRLLARTNNDGIPTNAIYIQSSLAILFILTSSFESILVFAGFTLALNSFATVLSIFVLRIKRPDINRPYQISAFPLPPLIYLTLTGWTLCFVLIERPVEALFGIGMIISGLIFYFISERTKKEI